MRWMYVMLALLWALPVLAKSHHDKEDEGKDSPALKDAVLLIIRHAEKPDSGHGLSPAGEKRAEAYVNYFKTFTVGSKPFTPEAIFAAADSDESRRPRLTIEPFAKSLGLAVETPYKDKQFAELAHELQSKPHGRQILICWHHGEIPALLHALGADPAKLLPDGKWPAETFGWVIQLRFDREGHLIPADTLRINENLMPDDK